MEECIKCHKMGQDVQSAAKFSQTRRLPAWKRKQVGDKNWKSLTATGLYFPLPFLLYRYLREFQPTTYPQTTSEHVHKVPSIPKVIQNDMFVFAWKAIFAWSNVSCMVYLLCHSPKTQRSNRNMQAADTEDPACSPTVWKGTIRHRTEAYAPIRHRDRAERVPPLQVSLLNQSRWIHPSIYMNLIRTMGIYSREECPCS